MDHTIHVEKKQKEKYDPGVRPFQQTLGEHDIRLARGKTHTLQVNVGLLCNQACRHCHLNAGPGKKEVMSRQTADRVASFAKRAGFETIDITGGAPELNPDIEYIVSILANQAEKLIFRSNLSALVEIKSDSLMELLTSLKATIVASFPSLNESQADSQRGDGIFRAGIQAMKKLNNMGYGKDNTGLELNLVSNPTGAFLAPSQAQTEKRFKKVLWEKWGVTFNNLFNFANVPLGRFRTWLEKSGNLESYMKKLADGFNPCAVDNVMCRTLVSVSWDGYLYDCDFNLAKGLHMGKGKRHVSQAESLPQEGSLIATADHCYTCTAGAGFT